VGRQKGKRSEERELTTRLAMTEAGLSFTPMQVKPRLRLILGGIAVFTGVPLLVLVGVWLALLASRAQLDGRASVPGLTAPVVVERDAQGIPLIQATNRTDLAFAVGFVHAQERFFQMDLMRRNSAGELAALLGGALANYDGQMRRHQLPATADQAMATLPDRHRAVLEAYATGVNAGLDSLKVRPPEYLLLRQKPRPWRPRDSLLVGMLMFERLQDSSGFEDRRRALLAEVLPPAALAFIDPDGSPWDTPLDAKQLPSIPLPGPEVLQFATNRPAQVARSSWESPLIPGSNNWGVDGSVSARGGAIIANDMHLDLGLPNIWYRVSARWLDQTSQRRRFDGVTLPGTPLFIVGSNGEIAWGFTNGTLDTTDLISLELDPANTRRYRTPDGWQTMEEVVDVIEVANGDPLANVFNRTIWGPVIGTNHLGEHQALRWVAHLSEATNLQLLELESASDVDAALKLAPTCGIPVQNLLVGDRQGALAWTLIGRLPRRIGFDGRTPVSWADGRCRWEGWLRPEEHPQVRGARLWTANNRISGQSNYLTTGPYQTDLGARARQIRDALQALVKPDETALFNLFRDDRALFLDRWQKLMLQTLVRGAAGTNGTAWTELKREVANWGGRAATNSVGYRLVRAFRFKTGDLFFEPLTDLCQRTGSDLPVDSARWEGPLWSCLTERPAHLLNSRFASYDGLLATAIDAVLADLQAQNLTLAKATWGQRNMVKIQHPLSRALPKLADWLDVLPTPLPGDDHMPRVQGVRFGPSERLVVSPGQEAQGFLQMPGGQSGHFLSPFYRSEHVAWETATPTPLLPGLPRYRLVLAP